MIKKSTIFPRHFGPSAMTPSQWTNAALIDGRPEHEGTMKSAERKLNN
jgi:hypothetical protein